MKKEISFFGITNQMARTKETKRKQREEEERAAKERCEKKTKKRVEKAKDPIKLLEEKVEKELEERIGLEERIALLEKVVESFCQPSITGTYELKF